MRVAFETLNGVKPAMSKNKKIGIIAACVAVAVVFGLGTLKLKQKQEAEKAQMEQIATEKKNQEMLVAFQEKKDAADAALDKGLDIENDSCEKFLFVAYTTYSQLAKDIKSNAVLSASEQEVASKMQTVSATLDSTLNAFNKVAEELAAFGENEMAETYSKRAAAIEQFKKSNKIK